MTGHDSMGRAEQAGHTLHTFGKEELYNIIHIHAKPALRALKAFDFIKY